MNEEKCCILVVDDDSFVSEMLALILSEDGYRVETAEHGRAALERLRDSGSIDLVISDMQMPEMDGLELITQIRKTGSEIPIIILTGSNEISVAITALKNGASDYLLKDENIQETVIISVAKVLEKHGLKLKNRQLMEDIANKNRILEHERVLARKVQEGILPRYVSIEGFEIATCYRPSDQIGGDFFDAFDTGSHVHFLIGDISGHSTSSALIMAVCKGMFLSLGQTSNDPLEIVAAANRMLCQVLSESGMFLTLVHAVFEKETGTVALVSAGHNPVYLLGREQLFTMDSTGPVLGWDQEDTWDVLRFSFEPGALLFFYTDGLVEARNNEGAEFGDQLLDKLTVPAGSPEELVLTMQNSLDVFSGKALEDDLTLFAIKRSP